MWFQELWTLWLQGCVGGDISSCSQKVVSNRHSLTVTGKVIDVGTHLEKHCLEHLCPTIQSNLAQPL